MLKQRIDGLSTKNISVSGSDGDLSALAGILAGEVETYKTIGQGGTEAPIPAVLNKKNFVVGKKTLSGRYSTMLTLPHVKTSSTYAELSASMIGLFDCDYNGTIKCEYATMKFDAQKEIQWQKV